MVPEAEPQALGVKKSQALPVKIAACGLFKPDMVISVVLVVAVKVNQTSAAGPVVIPPGSQPVKVG